MNFIDSITDFTYFAQNTHGKILAIDYGAKKMGLAMSNEINMAFPHDSYITKNDNDKIKIVIDVIQKYKINSVVIGWPLMLNGKENDSCASIKKFAEKLYEKSQLLMYLQDERMTSKAADNVLREMGYSRRERNEMDDMLAAKMILDTVISRFTRLDKSSI